VYFRRITSIYQPTNVGPAHTFNHIKYCVSGQTFPFVLKLRCGFRCSLQTTAFLTQRVPLYRLPILKGSYAVKVESVCSYWRYSHLPDGLVWLAKISLCDFRLNSIVECSGFATCNTWCSDVSVWSCVLSLQSVTPFGFRRLPLPREGYGLKGCLY